MDILKIFHEKPWHILLISSLVFTSTLTYLITSDIFRTDARAKLDVCLFHLRQKQATASHRHLTVSHNQTCFSSNYLNRLRLRQKLPSAPSRLDASLKCPHRNATILILSPFEEFPGYFRRFLGNIMSLTYPHCLIRIAIGIDQSLDGMPPDFQKLVKKLVHKFRALEVHTLSVSDTDADKLPKFADRHRKDIQLVRRRKLAKVRNALLFSALRDEKYVFWLDSDVREVPADILQTLISAHVPVVVPSCLYRKSLSEFDVYDRNSWRETEESRKFLNSKDRNFLMLEGYENKTLRRYLPHLASEGSLVKLDGVGACCLLVDANVHRQGAIFPFYLVNNHIETEGFAQVVKLLGYQSYGMPNVSVIH